MAIRPGKGKKGMREVLKTAESERVTISDKEEEKGLVGQIGIGTHFFNQLYLYAFATQGEVANYVRTQTLEEESARLQEILAKWATVQQLALELTRTEIGLADSTQLQDIPSEHDAALQQLESNALFQKSFSMLPCRFGIVEIDTLVAPQRAVNLDYVETLRKAYTGKSNLKELVGICLSTTRDMPPLQHLEVANSTHIFTSPNLDVRFLGAFLKKYTPEDAQFAVLGGIPVAAIISFVGYGASQIGRASC